MKFMVCWRGTPLWQAWKASDGVKTALLVAILTTVLKVSLAACALILVHFFDIAKVVFKWLLLPYARFDTSLHLFSFQLLFLGGLWHVELLN